MIKKNTQEYLFKKYGNSASNKFFINCCFTHKKNNDEIKEYLRLVLNNPRNTNDIKNQVKKFLDDFIEISYI